MGWKMRHRALALALLAASSWMAPAQESGARQASGRIRGRVASVAGAPVAGAVIKATCAGSGGVHTAQSNRDGAYELSSLAPCNYDLEARAEGFEPLAPLRIAVAEGSTVTKDLVLRPLSWPGWITPVAWFAGLVVLLAAAVGLYFIYRWSKRGSLGTKLRSAVNRLHERPVTPQQGTDVAPPVPAGSSRESEPGVETLVDELRLIRQSVDRVVEQLGQISQLGPDIARALREVAATGGSREGEPAGMELESVTKVYRPQGRSATVSAPELPTEERLKRAWEGGMPALRALGAQPAAVSNTDAMRRDPYLEPIFETVSGFGDVYLLDRPDRQGMAWLVPRPGATVHDCENRFTGIPNAFEVSRRGGILASGRARLIRAAQVQRDRNGWRVAVKGELELT